MKFPLKHNGICHTFSIIVSRKVKIDAKKPQNESSEVLWRRRRDLNPRAGFIQPTPLAGEPLRPLGYFCRSNRCFLYIKYVWRRGWDSNPRKLALRQFSRLVPSTARPPLHLQKLCFTPKRISYDTIESKSCQAILRFFLNLKNF